MRHIDTEREPNPRKQNDPVPETPLLIIPAEDSEPILVQISRLNIAPSSNAEIDAILSLRDAKCLVSAE